MKRSKALSFTITRDTREQLPYMFRFARQDPARWTKFKTTQECLVVGDYGVQRSGERIERNTPVQRIAVVERKTLSDLYKTIAQRRDNFILEMSRMAKYGYGCVVIEAPIESIRNPNATLPKPTKLNPKSVIATLLAISVRFRVSVWALPHRDGAEQFTFRILERWYLDGTHNNGRTSGVRNSDLQGAVFSGPGS